MILARKIAVAMVLGHDAEETGSGGFFLAKVFDHALFALRKRPF